MAACLSAGRRRRAEAARQELEASFALVDGLYASAPIGLAYVDLDGCFVRVNDRVAELDGVAPGAHAGRMPEEIVPELAEDLRRSVRWVIEHGEPIIDEQVMVPSRAQVGVRRWQMSFYPIHRDSQLLGVGITVVDVTEQQQVDRGLRAQADRYETLMLALSEVGEGMVVLEGMHLVFANPAFERLVGYALPELRAMDSIYDLVPEWHRKTAIRRAELRASEGQVDPHYETVVVHRSGRLLDLDAAAVPLTVDDRDQLVVVVRDVTSRKRAEAQREQALALEREARRAAESAERRMTLLASASALFDESLDELETLGRVARLVVAEVTDTCVVMLTDEAHGARQAIALARDPRREALMAELEPRWPEAFSPRETLAQVVRAGEARLVRHFTRTAEEHAEDDEHQAQIRALGLSAVALVPLRARGRIFGALACGFVDPPVPDHERETLALLDDLARRAALAIDNARLYAERSHVAQTLQQSLLPSALPEVPGLALAARYRPAGEGNEVGGDFYDCYETGPDEYALSIGDVVGKGAAAAAITALARYTMRASALHSTDPVRVLSELNEAILRQGLDLRFCTVEFVAVRRRGDVWRARMASGGHPLPLLLRDDGSVEQPGRPGTLLGVVPDPDLVADETLLRVGDSLILYTDGVIEASPLDDAFGPHAFAEFVGGLAGRSADEIAAAIDEAVVQIGHGQPRDDVAIVVLQVMSGA